MLNSVKRFRTLYQVILFLPSVTSIVAVVIFFKAIFDGVREFAAIAIIGSGVLPAFPCGVCRQVMSEFCDGDFIIVTSNIDGTEVVTETLDQMMPHRFAPKDLL